MPRVKLGTYPATLTAADWERVLTALGCMRDEYENLDLPGLAEDAQRTLDNLYPQVIDYRLALSR